MINLFRNRTFSSPRSSSSSSLSSRLQLRRISTQGSDLKRIKLQPSTKSQPHSRQIQSEAEGKVSKAGNMTTYNINITSDIVCPWCYIGHARLSRAISTHKQQYPDDQFKLTYRPFYLNPAAAQVKNGDPTNNNNNKATFPIESVDRRAYYAAKFGEARAQQIFSMLGKVATEEGLDFKFGGKTGSSRNGHRLVHFAQSHGGEKSQNDVMMGLWKRYFEQEIDITELDVLVSIGVEAGLGGENEIREFLTSGEGAEQVDSIAEEARLEGISGVPFYVVQDLWAVEGAQEPRAFEALFLKWKDIERKQTASTATTTQSDTPTASTAAGKGDSCL